MQKIHIKPMLKWLLFLVSGLGVISVAGANTPAQDLNTLLSSFKSLSAQFEQVVSGGRGHANQASTGTMALKRPGKFRWEVKQPSAQTLIADNDYFWIYDIDLQQATRQKLDQNNTNSPAFLLSGSISSLEDRFIITRTPNSDFGQGFRLKPKDKNDLFAWIELYFINNKLSDMRLADNLGTLTSFHFSAVQINPNLSDGLFKFKAPRGVEVIKN